MGGAMIRLGVVIPNASYTLDGYSAGPVRCKIDAAVMEGGEMGGMVIQNAFHSVDDCNA